MAEFWNFIDYLDFYPITDCKTTREAGREFNKMCAKIKRGYEIKTWEKFYTTYTVLRDQLMEKFDQDSTWSSCAILQGKEFYYSVLGKSDKKSANTLVEKIKKKYICDIYSINLDKIWNSSVPTIMCGLLNDGCCIECGVPFLSEHTKSKKIIGDRIYVFCTDCN